MDLTRPDRRERLDRLAAAHVLGTLRGGAGRRFSSLLPAHPTLQRAVAAWQERLAPLSVSLSPVQPPDRVWQAIELRLFRSRDATPASPSSTAAGRGGWWHSLGWWRAGTAVSTLACAGLLVVTGLPRRIESAGAPVLVVLAPQAGAATVALQGVNFAVSISADGAALVLKPVGDLSGFAATRQTLELWAVPPQGRAPRSLGLVQTSAGSAVATGTETVTRVLRSGLLKDTAAFAISVEPQGGSPTGAPTGPIVSVGTLTL